jgi:hypothetical protein
MSAQICDQRVRATGILSFMVISEKSRDSGEWHQKMDRLMELLEEMITLSGDLELDLLNHIARMALIEAFNQKAILMRQ